MTVREVICDIAADIIIEEKDNICMFSEYSGAGVTFMFKLLRGFLDKEGVKYTHLDYTACDRSVEAIAGYCAGSQFVLLDNADLYVTDDLLQALSETSCVLVHCKHPERLRVRYIPYTIVYNGGSLKVRRDQSIYFSRDLDKLTEFS